MEDPHFPEIVARTSFDKLHSLPKTGKPNGNQWTVLSTIVHEEHSRYEVVALGTGSKCIGPNKMSPDGGILNDSHSEVICRRAFMLYLYDEMDKALSNQTSIFTFCPKSLKFKLNDDVKYHFFSTMMPCGDASIFPKCDVNNTGDVVCVELSESKGNVKKRSANSDQLFCKKLKGNDGDIHRTGAKCLESEERKDPKEEGAGYHVTGVVRTKPGRGDPTLSVSCSDKITKWCYLGLQGALISIFLEKPIYLSTFTVAGNAPFCEESLERSFYNRIVDFKMVPPFENKKLTFQHAKDGIFNYQKNDAREVCPSSIIWYRKTEVAVEGRKQGITKKTLNLESSRLKICKAELSRRFKSLHQRVHSNIDHLSYSQCKEKAEEYQLNWKVLKSRLGKWPEKNKALLDFHQ